MDVVNTTGQDSHFQVGVGGGGGGGGIKQPGTPTLLTKQTLLQAHHKAKHPAILTPTTILFVVNGKTVTANLPAGTDTIELVEAHGVYKVVVHLPPQHQQPAHVGAR